MNKITSFFFAVYFSVMALLGVPFDYPDDFYRGANVQAAAIMNDLQSVTEYMESYKPLTEKHSWPLYNMDIARTAMAAKIMLDRYA